MTAWPKTTAAVRRLTDDLADLLATWRRNRAFALIHRSFEIDPRPLSEIAHRSYCRGADDLAARIKHESAQADIK